MIDDQHTLKQHIHYNPDTGIITRLSTGKTIESVNNQGYIHVQFCRQYKTKTISAHRLAWLYMTGSFPTHQIDHINGIRNDNRWVNLRECTSSQNQLNRHEHRVQNRVGRKLTREETMERNRISAKQRYYRNKAKSEAGVKSIDKKFAH